jgi:hypothetical protein
VGRSEKFGQQARMNLGVRWLTSSPAKRAAAPSLADLETVVSEFVSRAAREDRCSGTASVPAINHLL